MDCNVGVADRRSSSVGSGYKRFVNFERKNEYLLG